MIRFNYPKNLLVTSDKVYSLDCLRNYLMSRHETLCLEHKIRPIFRPGTAVKDIDLLSGGKKREITRGGIMVNTYDWDFIFFKAKQAGLVDQFIIYEDSANRSRTPEATTV